MTVEKFEYYNVKVKCELLQNFVIVIVFRKILKKLRKLPFLTFIYNNFLYLINDVEDDFFLFMKINLAINKGP